jgi:hypothetical protein
MKTIFEHIEYVKGKPHHIRKQVAFAAAAGITALIALVWLGASLGTGVLALKGNSFADSAKGTGTLTTGTADKNAALAGAAAALPNTNQNAPAHIEIVDTSSPSSGKKAEQTTLPF